MGELHFFLINPLLSSFVPVAGNVFIVVVDVDYLEEDLELKINWFGFQS